MLVGVILDGVLREREVARDVDDVDRDGPLLREDRRCPKREHRRGRGGERSERGPAFLRMHGAAFHVVLL